MKLKTLIANFNQDAVYRVATDDGEGWIYSSDVEGSMLPENLLEREVVNMYTASGRSNCGGGVCDLKEGIAIVVEGKEWGMI